MEENENRDPIKPDSEQANPASPQPHGGTIHGVETEDRETHNGKRASNKGEADIASVMKQVEWPMIILTAIIAIATAANVIVYWCESESASKQTQQLIDVAKLQSGAASDMADAAWNQVEAANNFADSAEEINRGVAKAASQLQISAENNKRWIDTAQQSMRLDQRAWLSATITQSTIEANKPISAKLRIANVGRTPATKVDLRAKMEPIVGNTLPAFTYNVTVAQGEIATGESKLGTLLPGGEMFANIPLVAKGSQGLEALSLDPGKLGNLTSGSVKLYLHGELDYCDAFRLKHWIKFCYVYDPNEAQPSPTGRFIACEEHNETDDLTQKPEPCPAAWGN